MTPPNRKFDNIPPPAEENPAPTQEPPAPIKHLRQIFASISAEPQSYASYSFGGRCFDLPPIPGLSITGFGLAAFPLTNEAAESLILAAATRSPFDSGFLDADIGDDGGRIWEIDAGHLQLTNPEWPEGLDTLRDEIAASLGQAGAGIELRLRRLVIFEPGAQCERRSDAEELDDQFGTLVVQLPSVHKGGLLKVFRAEDGPSVVHDFGQAAGAAPFNCHFAVYPMEAEWQVTRVADGHLTRLEFAVCWRERQPRAIDFDTKQQVVEGLEMLGASEEPLGLVFFEDYYEQGKVEAYGKEALRGVDRNRFNVLLAANEALKAENQFEFKFALVERHFSFQGDDHWDSYRDEDLIWKRSYGKTEVVEWLLTDGTKDTGFKAPIQWRSSNTISPATNKWGTKGRTEFDVVNIPDFSYVKKVMIYERLVLVFWPKNASFYWFICNLGFGNFLDRSPDEKGLISTLNAFPYLIQHKESPIILKYGLEQNFSEFLLTFFATCKKTRFCESYSPDSSCHYTFARALIRLAKSFPDKLSLVFEFLNLPSASNMVQFALFLTSEALQQNVDVQILRKFIDWTLEKLTKALLQTEFILEAAWDLLLRLPSTAEERAKVKTQLEQLRDLCLKFFDPEKLNIVLAAIFKPNLPQTALEMNFISLKPLLERRVSWIRRQIAIPKPILTTWTREIPPIICTDDPEIEAFLQSDDRERHRSGFKNKIEAKWYIRRTDLPQFLLSFEVDGSGRDTYVVMKKEESFFNYQKAKKEMEKLQTELERLVCFMAQYSHQEEQDEAMLEREESETAAEMMETSQPIEESRAEEPDVKKPRVELDLAVDMKENLEQNK